MLSQSLKDVYFLLNRFAVVPATMWARLRFARRTDLVIHLGSGDDYREGMINVDGNLRRRKDLWLDLRNRLPFANQSVRLLYCCHMLEHVFPEDALRLLSEMHRVTSPTGVVRLAVPSFERCLEISRGEIESRWPREFDDALSQAINYIFCDGQHKYAYCFHNLSEFARQAGFTHIRNVSAEDGLVETDYGGVTLGKEPPGSLVVELRR